MNENEKFKKDFNTLIASEKIGVSLQEAFHHASSDIQNPVLAPLHEAAAKHGATVIDFADEARKAQSLLEQSKDKATGLTDIERDNYGLLLDIFLMVATTAKSMKIVGVRVEPGKYHQTMEEFRKLEGGKLVARVDPL